MALHYTETRTQQVTQTKTLTAPKEFSCYTSASNRSLHNHAKTLVAKLERITADSSADFYARRKRAMSAILAYFKSYQRFCSTKSGYSGGAGDTAVREVVWGFGIKAGKSASLDIDSDDVDRLYDEAEAVC